MAGQPQEEDEGVRGAGNARNHRIDQLRQQIDQLKARIAAVQAEQRKAVMELNELLQEKRHIAARARRRQRAARWPPPPEPDTTPDSPDEGREP